MKTKIATHGVRIAAGKWKKSRLLVPEVKGFRPTPARVRETLFNWLGQDLNGWSVADCFAGSGILGLEAASRGAAQVWFLERDKILLKSICNNVNRLCVDKSEVAVFRVFSGDVLQSLPRLEQSELDLVFLDPPYQSRLYAQIVPLAWNALAKDGLLYVEAGVNLAQSGHTTILGFHSERYLQTGQVHAHLWRKSDGYSQYRKD